MKKRNYVLISILVISCSTISIAIGTAIVYPFLSSNDPLIVETEYGMVKGKEWDQNTYSWLGIPFAKPPIGNLRWKAPVDPDSWSGILDTTGFPQAPIQYANWMACTNEDDILSGNLIGSEDCLYLNVWAPKESFSDPSEELPVYVYIYGGGNIVGQSNFPIYYGGNLAEKAGCIVVTMNYRVGIAGWFYNPAFHNGNPLDDSGNYGLLDIIKSLEWVKTNIRNFGGNPNEITVAGESAGAMNTYALLTSPYLKTEFFDKGNELFHRAVIESGGIIPTSIDSGIEALVSKGIASDMDEASEIIDSASDLQIRNWLMNEPMQNLYALFPGTDFLSLFGLMSVSTSLISDGYVCSSNPYLSLIEGNFIQVPTIIGCNEEEIKVFMSWMIDEDLFNTVMFGHPTPDDLAFYVEKLTFWPDELDPYLNWILYDALQLVADVGTVFIKLVGVDLPATLMRLHQTKVYCYEFAWGQERVPFDFLVGACHGSEIPFIFGNVEDEEGYPFNNVLWSEDNKPGRIALSDAMISYWKNFIYYGDPGDPDGGWWLWEGLPNWDVFLGMTSLSDKRIIFDATDTEIDIYMDA